MDVISDEELRHMTIELANAPTERDEQTRIGASNLANQCDYCLACNLLGDMRETIMAKRPWLGRFLGTAMHAIFQARMEKAIRDFRAGKKTRLATIAAADPTAVVEQHVCLGEIPDYGPIWTTLDLGLRGRGTVGDYKGSERKKLFPLLDAIAIMKGEEPPYGRKHKNVKLSEKDYDEAIQDAIYKITGYSIQLGLYGLAAERNLDMEVHKLSIIFVLRDGNGWFDNPNLEDYENPVRAHDIVVLSFPYRSDLARAAFQRGTDIWNHLQAGGTPDDFERHERCFTCNQDRRSQRMSEPLPDIELEISPELLATAK